MQNVTYIFLQKYIWVDAVIVSEQEVNFRGLHLCFPINIITIINVHFYLFFSLNWLLTWTPIIQVEATSKKASSSLNC